MIESSEAIGSEEVDATESVPTSEFLTFTLEHSAYAVDILRVQEIRGWQVVTRVPNTPNFVVGVLNMRGAIVPIIDLREKFSFEPEVYTSLHVIIVLAMHDGDDERIMGVIVDGVQDVISVTEKDIKPAPLANDKDQIESISGLASVKDQMITILDVDKLLTLSPVVDL